MKKNIDLGTLINAEMYYSTNTNILNGKNSKCNTLHHQGDDNVQSPTATTFALQDSSEEEELRGNVCGLLGGNGSTTQNQQVMSKVPGFVRLNPNVKYDRIGIQLGNFRNNERYKRANIYVSLKEDTEAKFNVFLTGSLTSAKTEVYRGCKNSQAVKDIVDAMYNTYPDIMIGRLRYKPINGYITDFHKKLTKSAVIGVYQNSNLDYVAVLVLYYEFFEIPLTSPLSDKQNSCYVAHGVYDDYEEFDDE